MQEGETLHLIDLKRTDRFAASFDKLSAQQQAQISFHECSSRSPALEDLTKGAYRFIHIDGGHSKKDVHDDAHRFAALLAPKGIVVFDDVFEIRWPGVTEAVLEYLVDAPIAPFMIVDRKLYPISTRIISPSFNVGTMLSPVTRRILSVLSPGGDTTKGIVYPGPFAGGVPAGNFDGAFTGVGDVVASDISLVNHVHGGITPGPADTGKPS